MKRAGQVNASMADALFNDVDPQWALARERPIHRLIVELGKQGLLLSEISAATGMSMGAVANTLRQPWARANLVSDLKKTIQEEVRDMLAKEMIPCIETQVSIRDSVTSTDEAKLKATSLLQDRFFGRPTQPIEQRQQNIEHLPDAELEQIVREGSSSTTTVTATPDQK